MDDSWNKKLLAFLNGLARRKYFGEDISDELLKDQVLGEADEEVYAAIVSKYERLMGSIVATDMDFNQLDEFLKAQMKKKEGALDSSEAATIRRFWKQQKSKIHEEMVSKTAWDNEMKSFSWRIDACSQATDVVHFELGEEQVKKLLSQVEDIERAIAAHTAS